MMTQLVAGRARDATADSLMPTMLSMAILTVLVTATLFGVGAAMMKVRRAKMTAVMMTTLRVMMMLVTMTARRMKMMVAMRMLTGATRMVVMARWLKVTALVTVKVTMMLVMVTARRTKMRVVMMRVGFRLGEHRCGCWTPPIQARQRTRFAARWLVQFDSQVGAGIVTSDR